MEYNQNYENDLNILTKQLNKISLEKSYEKLIEPYKNNPALVKMLHKKMSIYLKNTKIPLI